MRNLMNGKGERCRRGLRLLGAVVALLSVTIVGCPPNLLLTDLQQKVDEAQSQGLPVATPTFSPSAAGSTYVSYSDLTILVSCATAGATVYYTVDGTTPNKSSAIYGAPIAISGIGSSVTLRAFATLAGKTDSGVASMSYLRSGIVETVAGIGTAGYSGDGGAATAAELNLPVGLALGQGTMWISDSSNNCIRHVDQSGVITTLEGGLHAPMCLAYRPPNILGIWILYIADSSANCVRAVNPNWLGGGLYEYVVAGSSAGDAGYAGDGGPATSALLNDPTGIVLSPSGNLYFSDAYNNCVRMVDSAGNIYTIAGNGASGFSGDGGPATAAKLSFPSGLAVDSLGNLYISDAYNNCVRMINSSGVITRIAGLGPGAGGHSGDGGPAVNAKLNVPAGLAIDSRGNLFIADVENNCIRRVDTKGTITTVAGSGSVGYSGDGGPATSAQFNMPINVLLDSADCLYICDYYNNRVRKIN